jgi:hypothetical protein
VDYIEESVKVQTNTGGTMATAEQKARQRANKKAEGGRQISALLSADEAALLDKVKAANPQLSQKDLIVAGLEALSGAKITRAQVVSYLERNLR